MKDNGGGIFTFSTDYNLHYACLFSDITNELAPLIGIYDMRIKTFDFDEASRKPGERQKKIQDARIASTLASVITHYFDSPNKVLIYLCEAEERPGLKSGESINLAKARQALFRGWHRMFESNLKRQEKVFIDRSEGNDGGIIYACTLYRTDIEPAAEAILNSEFIDKAHAILGDKFSGFFEE